MQQLYKLTWTCPTTYVHCTLYSIYFSFSFFSKPDIMESNRAGHALFFKASNSNGKWYDRRLPLSSGQPVKAEIVANKLRQVKFPLSKRHFWEFAPFLGPWHAAVTLALVPTLGSSKNEKLLRKQNEIRWTNFKREYAKQFFQLFKYLLSVCCLFSLRSTYASLLINI